VCSSDLRKKDMKEKATEKTETDKPSLDFPDLPLPSDSDTTPLPPPKRKSAVDNESASQKDDDWDDDEEEKSKETPENRIAKKMAGVGGFRLFPPDPNSDPSVPANTKKETPPKKNIFEHDEEPVSEETEPAPKTFVPPKGALVLPKPAFQKKVLDDSEDDKSNESEPAPKKTINPPKPEEPAKKTQAKTFTWDDDEDDPLQEEEDEIPKKTTDKNIKSAVAIAVVDKEPEKEPVKEAVKEQPKNPPKSSLWGLDDEEEEESIFTTKKVEVKAATPAPVTATKPAVTAKKSAFSFEEESDEDVENVFKTKEEPKVVAKAPEKEKVVSKVIKQESDEDEKPEPVIPTGKGKVAALAGTLKFNPMAMMPGATRAPKKVVVDEVPEKAVKRAKGAANRRLPAKFANKVRSEDTIAPTTETKPQEGTLTALLDAGKTQPEVRPAIVKRPNKGGRPPSKTPAAAPKEPEKPAEEPESEEPEPASAPKFAPPKGALVLPKANSTKNNSNEIRFRC